ncbi:HEPN domain-containing protein [Roseofilum sp. BLCC_M91]|uniref:HEPN domain-containing protein n=1 Tax=Roseofilum halophilum BLCC-M91 TaxID=3022259 RepID=A0ABT7BFE6_9CYAN|nr:HEPN domain-containing protein [Roseofilum halophilum]MDJ1177895.1 HEPN domain-containing protein [Roseofilum halophilum BLCC-M91]
MTQEQRLLLEKARRSIQGAELLVDNGLPDLAVSRAYYAMFYIASAFILGQGLSFSSHSAVISAFGRDFAKENDRLRSFHRALIDAQDQRNRSDYNLDSGIDDRDAFTLIQVAKDFIQAFESFV